MIDVNRVAHEPIQNPEKFTVPEPFLQQAIDFATGKVMEIMPDFVHEYPTASSYDLQYVPIDICSEYGGGSNWTHGFYTGMLWTAYELTGNALYQAVAETQFDDYEKRYNEYCSLNHHDIGFLYVPSIIAQYKITGAQKARELGLKAADVLANRYSDVARIIQVRDKNPAGEFIIDCTMNLPLLFWAAKETGDRSYFLKALNHLTRMTECMVREDASSYQCYKIDEVTGEPIKGWTSQGYSDESCWARGQAWAIYGLAIAYNYVLDPDLLELAQKLANYFLNRLPTDTICNWDLIFTGDDDQRDTSSVGIVASGLLELAKHLPDENEDKKVYVNAAEAMLYHLHKEYTTQGVDSNGLLQHGVYAKRLGFDECCLWGDYFYMEALLRMQNPDWNCYW